MHCKRIVHRPTVFRYEIIMVAKNLPVSDNILFQWPYFVVDLLILSSSKIVMDPSESIFRFVIKIIQTMWEENLYAIKPLLSDTFFHSFTRYKHLYFP